jgi:hypothetical protein
MDEQLRQKILDTWKQRPLDCRHTPGSEQQLLQFEAEVGPIPPDFRWFLATCGGGVCGSEWVDGINELPRTHRKFRAESRPGGWTMQKVFVIGWDGWGNPFGIERATGWILMEDHDFGGVHQMAESVQLFLAHGLQIHD